MTKVTITEVCEAKKGGESRDCLFTFDSNGELRWMSLFPFLSLFLHSFFLYSCSSFFLFFFLSIPSFSLSSYSFFLSLFLSLLSASIRSLSLSCACRHHFLPLFCFFCSQVSSVFVPITSQPRDHSWIGQLIITIRWQVHFHLFPFLVNFKDVAPVFNEG